MTQKRRAWPWIALAALVLLALGWWYVRDSFSGNAEAGTAYAASKAALSALTREMASDFGKRGVRVNAIAPGEILTGILSPGSEEAMLPSIPLGRFGTSEEVAETIFFLCNDSAGYINGAELHVNGGQHV